MVIFVGRTDVNVPKLVPPRTGFHAAPRVSPSARPKRDLVMTDLDTQKYLANLVSNHKVLLFMKGNKTFPQCGFSAAVIEVLKRHGVPFETINVLQDANVRDGIKQFSSWPTIPQLYINGEFIGGCDIVREMDANGELADKLQQTTTA